MRITGRTRLAGIMGWPVTHSRSPALHNFWIDEHGIDGAYVPLPVRPEHLSQALRALPALGFRAAQVVLRAHALQKAVRSAGVAGWVHGCNGCQDSICRREKVVRAPAASHSFSGSRGR